MPVTIHIRADARGRKVLIEHELGVAELFPELGGPIYTLTYKPKDYRFERVASINSSGQVISQ